MKRIWKSMVAASAAMALFGSGTFAFGGELPIAGGLAANAETSTMEETEQLSVNGHANLSGNMTEEEIPKKERLGGQTIFGTQPSDEDMGDLPAMNDGSLLLLDFCNDPELNAWFEAAEEDLPVRLEYWVFGEAPYAMEFMDPELISETLNALKTVVIGEATDFDPAQWCDAGGDTFYFEMADGSKQGFAFEMNHFQWDDSGYHVVESYGDLLKVMRELNEIGNPDDTYIYSEDDGFYTQCSEIYETRWYTEQDLLGGLNIFLNDVDSSPVVTIARCFTDVTDADVYLEEAVPVLIEEMTGSSDWYAEDVEDTEFTAGTMVLPGMHYTLNDGNGNEYQLLVLILNTHDSLLNEEHLVRFCALYQEDEEEQEKKEWNPAINAARSEVETVNDALYKAIKEFNLIYMAHEESEVQEGASLFEFCNDDRLDAWLEKVAQEPAEELIYTADTWYLITDPDAIQTVIEALATVQIGGVSDAHVGGSDRQIFDFMDESGNGQTFMFFADTFNYEGESYEVLDWGELSELDLTGMAE